MATRTCFVGGFSLVVDDYDLRAAFLPFGPVESAKVERDEEGLSQSYGFVTFVREASMQKAVKAMDGQPLTKARAKTDFDSYEYWLLSLFKLVVRAGRTVVDFVRECGRCGQVGHMITDCRATDSLEDPKHVFRGLLMDRGSEYWQGYVLTEQDWPFNPPQGWTPRMYREIKRMQRAAKHIPSLGYVLIPRESCKGAELQAAVREAVEERFTSASFADYLYIPPRKYGPVRCTW